MTTVAGRGRKRGRSALRGATLAVVAVGAVALLLPRSWTRWLGGLGQVLLPFQDGVSLSADSVVEHLPGSSPEACADLLSQKEAVEHRAAALAIRVQTLEDEVRLLTATRLWDAGGARLGSRGRLVPARVITDDLLPWRASRLIDAGESHGVSRGDPVTTRDFTIAFSEQSGVNDGQAIVAGEVLVGFVERASSQTAYVRLLSDPESGMKVRIGRTDGGPFQGPDRYFWLGGRGAGRMQIADAERTDVESGVIRAGDLVLSDPRDEILPTAMVIGRVAEIAENPENPLFAVLGVAGAAAERPLRRVYVFDPGGELDGTPAAP